MFFTLKFLNLYQKVSKVGMATSRRVSKRTQIAYEHDAPPASVAEKKKKIFEPEKWTEVYNFIKQMRSKQAAPVDTMGCEKCHDGQNFNNPILFH